MNTPKLFRPKRTTLMSLLAAALASSVIAPNAFAFKVGIHDKMTTELLQDNGFDADSADEVADSNFYTDLMEPHVDAAHADANHLDQSSLRLRNKRKDIIEALAQCKRREALDALGEALHTVQDVYSHSNAVDNHHDIPDLLEMRKGTAVCDSNNNFAPGGLVTGYFSLKGYLRGLVSGDLMGDQCSDMLPNFCCHRELNKDAPKGEINSKNYFPALAKAEVATVSYLSLVEQEIARVFSNDSRYYLDRLQGSQRHLAFVIDTTASMGTDLDNVKTQVQQMVADFDRNDEAPTLGLVTFKDTAQDYGAMCDADKLSNLVDSLYPAGGDYCPEASNTALLTALKQFPLLSSVSQKQGGRIVLATDASSHDAAKAPFVSALAKLKGVKIDAILTGDCVAEESAPITTEGALMVAAASQAISLNDPNSPEPIVAATTPLTANTSDPLTSASARTQLRALTNETGGVLFQVGRYEVDDLMPTLLQLSSPDTRHIAERKLTLGISETRTVLIPVDDTVKGNLSLMSILSHSGALPAIKIYRPNGSLLDLNSTQVTTLNLSSLRNVMIETPEVGTWKVELTGGASFTFKAVADSSMNINAVRFVDLTAHPSRPEVEAMPLSGELVVGQEVVADVRLTHKPNVTQVNLLALDGSVLQTLVAETEDNRYFRIRFAVPNQRFIIQMVGTTVAGSYFSRETEVPYQPRNIGVAVLPELISAAPGQTATLSLKITNHSNSNASYRISTSGSKSWPLTFNPFVQIEKDEAKQVPIQVNIPATASVPDLGEFLFVVENSSISSDRNHASAQIHVATAEGTLDCSNASAEPAIIWEPDHKMADIVIKGVTGGVGDAINYLIDRVTQDEPVFINGDGSAKTAPDVMGVGTDAISVRAERSGNGDGRVYNIHFTATDNHGNQCQSKASVAVPHSSNTNAIDSGFEYDSTSK